MTFANQKFLPRTCVECGAEYVPTHPQTKVCSGRCSRSVRTHQRREARRANPSAEKRALRLWINDNPAKRMLYSAKRRAILRGLEFSLTEADVVVPILCPVFGTRLAAARAGVRSGNAPSLDRINPALGYVPDNVWVISDRANRIKNDATPAELSMLVQALSSLNREL